MAKVNVTLNHAGVREVLKSDEIRLAVDEAAGRVAAAAAGRTNLPIVVDHYTTDRAAAAVVITDARGMLVQARDGVLTAAAADAGLDVKAKRG